MERETMCIRMELQGAISDWMARYHVHGETAVYEVMKCAAELQRIVNTNVLWRLTRLEEAAGLPWGETWKYPGEVAPMHDDDGGDTSGLEAID